MNDTNGIEIAVGQRVKVYGTEIGTVEAIAHGVVEVRYANGTSVGQANGAGVEVVGSSFTIGVASDVFAAAPHPEDGSPREGLRFYVVAEDEAGNRWVHERVFESVGRGARDAVEAQAERLASRVRGALAAGTWSAPGRHWQRSRPAYGSPAYDRGGWSAMDAADERAAEGAP